MRKRANVVARRATAVLVCRRALTMALAATSELHEWVPALRVALARAEAKYDRSFDRAVPSRPAAPVSLRRAA